MKALLLTLSLFAGFSAQAEAIRFKTIAEMRSHTEYYITCSSRGGSEQIHITFHINVAMVGSFGIIAGGVAILSPGEALVANSWTGGVVQMSGGAGDVKIFGEITTGQYGRFNVEFKDATNGRFKGKASYSNGSTLTIDRDVTCAATNYTLPRPE